jgi:hypothetical protein
MGKLRYTSRLFSEFVQFARENKVYWIVPLVVVLVVLVGVVAVGQAAAPFIYTLF